MGESEVGKMEPSHFHEDRLQKTSLPYYRRWILMPVILPKHAESDGLNPANTASDKLLSLLKPYPSEEMEAMAINPASPVRLA